MADYGLAAQIGRGVGGAGVQPVDQTNRMLQLMQLQQMQQNMMLAREAEARQQQLFPLLRREKEAGIQTETMRQGLVGAQTSRAVEEAASARRAGAAETGVLDYIRNTPPAERTNPERLDALRQREPGAYQILTDQINKARELKAKAEEAGYSAMRKRFEMQQMALAGMSTLLPAVTDQSKYETLYRDFSVIDPVGAKLIGPEFTPRNLASLRARIQDLSDLEYKTDAFGREYMLNKRTGKTAPVAGEAAPPAPGVAPAQLGIAPDAFAQPAMTSADAARAAAGTPIIQPRAPVPEGLGPKAEAQRQQTAAIESAKSAVVSEDRRRGAGEVLKAISDPKLDKLIMGSTSGRGERFMAEIPAFFGISTSGMEKIGQLGTIESQITTQLLGGKLGSGISNADVNLIREGVGQISNPNIPANQRLAALKQLRNNLKALSEGKEIAVAEPESGAAFRLSPDVDALLKKYQ